MILDSRYEVLEKIGSGSWATVYKVKDIRTDKIYSLKHFIKLDAKELYEKFRPEDMHHITKIRHPNLINVSHFGNANGYIYYISEFYKGFKLDKFRFRKTNMQTIYDMVVEICYALDVLHQQGIIHQDLKPGNILYRIEKGNPEIKVLDYGFIKVDNEQRAQTISGTLSYIAPEVFLGKKPLPQSDFYSLGVTLYYITTRTLPFSSAQITSLQSGDPQNFIPKFPSELNPDIPKHLENFILKLIEKNVDDRFKDVASIISYINNNQPKNYPFSLRKTLVTSIKHSSYLVRENYSHKLLKFVPEIKNGNGRLITLVGGKGLGKSQLLSLFKYHLLTGEFFIFDYTLSSKNKDPFFALIKEYYTSYHSNKNLEDDLNQFKVSEYFKEYLSSEVTPETIKESNNDLKKDFAAARRFILHLCNEQPIVFIVKMKQFRNEDTMAFLNYIYDDITKNPIMIILSVENTLPIKKLEHYVHMQVENFNKDEVKAYVKRLLKVEPPENFIEQLFQRTNGNPRFIRDTLIDLTEKRIIWNENNFNFDYSLENYKLTDFLLRCIFRRMKNVSNENLERLKKLSVILVPLSKRLIQYILEMNDQDTFFFINDNINNEILVKKGDYYYFTYRELQEKFRQKCRYKVLKKISDQVIKYFQNRKVDDIESCVGLIENARIVADYKALRKYSLKLVQLYSESFEQEKAFSKICEIIKLDFSSKINVSQKDLLNDLYTLRKQAELTGSVETALELIKSIPNFPDIFEKFYIQGMFYNTLGKYNLAKENLEMALRKSITGIQFVRTKIAQIWTFVKLKETKHAGKVVAELENQDLTKKLEMRFINRKSIYLDSIGQTNEAIEALETYLSKVEAKNETEFLIRLASLHNNLAYLYNKQRFYEDARKHFDTSKNLWERVNYRRYLPTIYNNIGDLALRHGDTNTAFDYFKKALTVGEKTEFTAGKSLAWVNFGEAYIKLGKFEQAEKSLLKAKELIKKSEDKEFLPSVVNNLALAKSKIRNFGVYYEFIEKYSPETLKKVDKINPLTKTYLYYLVNIGQYDKVFRILNNNIATIKNQQQEEFYYQMLGLIYLQKRNYHAALENIKTSLEFTKNLENVYAQTINYIRLTECYLGLNQPEVALENYKLGLRFAKKYNFSYWQLYLEILNIKIKLQKKQLTFRKIIRKLHEIIFSCKKAQLFLLEITCYEILFQLYQVIKQNELSKEYFQKYKEKVVLAAEAIPENDRETYFKKKMIFTDDFKNVKTITIKNRSRLTNKEWEDIYGLLRLKESSRIKFFIKDTFNKLFSPYKYAIIMKEELKDKKEPFIIENYRTKDVYSEFYLKRINKSLNKKKMVEGTKDSHNILFIPLNIKSIIAGVLVVEDSGEMKYTRYEKYIFNTLKLHLASLLLKIKEFSEINNNINLMNKFVDFSKRITNINQISRLIDEFTIFMVDFTNSRRGFFVTKGEEGQFIYKSGVDNEGNPIKDYKYISKTVLAKVLSTKSLVLTNNAKEDSLFESSMSIHEYNLHSICCAPIFVNNKIFGLIYLDNYNNKKQEIFINRQFLDMVFTQFSNVIRMAETYNEIINKNAELNQLPQLQQKFISIAAHELNTPITKIQSQFQKLRKLTYEEENNKKKKDAVNILGKEIHQLHFTVKDITNFAKYSVMNSLYKEKTDIKGVLENIMNEAKILVRERDLDINLNIGEDIPEINVNWEAFYIMIYNLVLNAVRFTPDHGEIEIGVRLSIYANEEVNNSESVVIYVKDNGIGMAKNELNKIFKPFYESKDILSHQSGITGFNQSGLGLGLTLCQIIVELHDGKIWINSEINKGTQVFVSLPIE